MLARIKIFPLCLHSGIGLKIKVGLAALNIAALQNIKYAINENGVYTSLLILGTNGNKSQINNAGVLYQAEQLDKSGESKASAAFLYRVANAGEAKTEAHDFLVLIADEEKKLLVYYHHKLIYQFILSISRDLNRTVKMAVALGEAIKEAVAVFCNILLL